jgi:hypothetical protein
MCRFPSIDGSELPAASPAVSRPGRIFGNGEKLITAFRSTAFAILLSLTAGVTDARADCTDPAGKRGALAYNDTYSVLQVCDGIVWSLVGGRTSLSFLADVNIPAPANGAVLTYNSATSKWEAAAPGTGGISALTGDVSASGTGSVAATIASNAVTAAKISNSNVTNAKLANMAANTVKGNNTGTSAAPLDLTMAQLRGILASGTADNTTFLRGDGTWIAPTGDGTGITALTGEVTASGTGSVAATITNNAVTSAKILDGTIVNADLANSTVSYAKIQNVSATSRLLGRASAGAGVIEELTIGSGLSLSGTTLNATGDGTGITALTGEVTASGTGSVAATIANNAVTSAKILDGTIANADIANSTIANAKLANMAASTVKGNNTASAAAPIDLTMPQLRTMIASGTPDSSSFLRGDGTWQAVPAGTVTGSGAANHIAYWNSASGITHDASQLVWQAVPAGTVTGSGAANHIAYWNSASGITHDASQLVWDATNNRLGVGVASPSYAIDTASPIRAASYQYTSDRNLKTEIETAGGLDIVTRLRGVSFRWKDSGKLATGVIAQEVAEVLPAAVDTDDKGVKSVDYMQIIGPMIEAIKQLKADNDDLSALSERQLGMIGDLRAANDNQSAEIDRLRAEIETFKRLAVGAH